MASLQAYNLLLPSSSQNHKRIHTPSIQTPPSSLSPPNPITNNDPAITLNIATQHPTTTTTTAKLFAVAEAAADRAEMHAIIAKQRDNWNHLLLHSTNSITLTASIAAGISSLPSLLHSSSSPHLHLAFKLSSALLFAASAAVTIITSRIQPSQLAEEQRNASRLFRQLEKSIHTKLSMETNPREFDVEEAMERVFALDKAYPLSLLPGMLEKFPKKVEPTVWWPKPRSRSKQGKGWNRGLEKEMEGIAEMMRRRDIEQYVSFGRKVLGISRVLSVLGPMLNGAAAIGASLCGVKGWGWPVVVAVVGGAVAAAVNTMQHGGQVGMVFELCRNCGGYYKELEEEIGWNLREEEEDGGLFEMKVGLRLGRRVCELKGFGGDDDDDKDEGGFAGKLF